MPSEQEVQYHRTFLSLHMCRTIYNEDARHQYTPGGVPNRQKKIESDPLYKYHVHSGPRYPQRAPGVPTDPEYPAFLARGEGVFDPLTIIPKRGQRFASVATEWEQQNSRLCRDTKFSPVVNAWMEVTGHFAKVQDSHLIHPAGVAFTDVSEYITNDIPLYLWNHQVFDASNNELKDASKIFLPKGWSPVSGYHGGVSILVLPNGQIIGARGHLYASNNGHAQSVASPLDFWTPGSRLAAAAIRGLTNRVGAAVTAGFKLLSAPTKELAELTLSRWSGRTLPGVAVPTLPVEHVGRRTVIMGEDMGKFRPYLAQSAPEAGFYDVVIHGDTLAFQILVRTNANGQQVWREVSAREVASVVKPRLSPGDQIRLLACETGCATGGPAQQLANELNHKVWAPTTAQNAVPIKVGQNRTTFVPDGKGTFTEFTPERGGGAFVGNGGKGKANEMAGEIHTGGRK